MIALHNNHQVRLVQIGTSSDLPVAPLFELQWRLLHLPFDVVAAASLVYEACGLKASKNTNAESWKELCRSAFSNKQREV
jgi:hypothetical protein